MYLILDFFEGYFIGGLLFKKLLNAIAFPKQG